MTLCEGRKAEEREQKEKRERHEAERSRRRLRNGGASETKSEGEFQGGTTLVTTPSLLLWLENLTKCMESPAGQL